MKQVNFAFLGATNYSKELLLFMVNKGFVPKVIFTIPEVFTISYSDDKVINKNFGNINEIAKELDIPCYEVDSGEGNPLKNYHDIIESLDLDLLLVLGWYYMIPKKIRDLTKYGAWGIHASLLPKYAGGAPLNWAIINGEKETGITLFRMEDGVDDGDIIAQEAFEIEYDDNISSVYGKATMSSKKILLKTLLDIENVNFHPQNKEDIQIYPQRKPEDGEINLNMSSKELYDFIRAQSSPYPGAYIKTSDGKKLVIESARIEDL